MAFFFSKSTRGFYHSELHEAYPSDAVEITEQQHRELLEAQGRGLEIQAGDDGRPFAAPRVEQPLSIEEKRQRARMLLQESDVDVMRAYESGEPMPPALRNYRELLRMVVRGQRSEIPTKP